MKKYRIRSQISFGGGGGQEESDCTTPLRKPGSHLLLLRNYTGFTKTCLCNVFFLSFLGKTKQIWPVQETYKKLSRQFCLINHCGNKIDRNYIVFKYLLIVFLKVGPNVLLSNHYFHLPLETQCALSIDLIRIIKVIYTYIYEVLDPCVIYLSLSL